MEKIFTLRCCFFFRMVASWDLVELDHLTSCDPTLLVQDLDRMFRICQVHLEWCHFGICQASLSLQISSCPSLVKPLSPRGLQPQTIKVGASCLHSSLGATLRLLSFLGYDTLVLRPHNNVWTKYSFLS
jgi:hypothetical protein